MDWKNSSGRIDNFEFEKIKSNTLGTSLGKLSNVMGGKLTFEYDSDLKISGSLEVVNTKPVNNCLIRVWYKPTYNGKTEKFELCTCYAESTNFKYENGQWSGTINLRSTLARYIDDQMTTNWVIAKYSSKSGGNKKRALNYFDNLVTRLGGFAKRSGVANKKYDKNIVYEIGTCPMDIFKAIAKHVDGRITCDTHGRMVLQKNVKPRNKKVQKLIPAGSYSVTLPGLTLDDTSPGTPNRYAVRFTYKNSKGKNVTIYGKAQVAKTSRLSYKNQGRWITKTETLNAMKPKTKARANAIAKSRLSNVAYSHRYWKLRCFFLPLIEPCLNGDVVMFTYGTLDIDGLVYSIDMDLSAGGMMDVTLRQVRSRDTI